MEIKDRIMGPKHRHSPSPHSTPWRKCMFTLLSKTVIVYTVYTITEENTLGASFAFYSTWVIGDWDKLIVLCPLWTTAAPSKTLIWTHNYNFYQILPNPNKTCCCHWSHVQMPFISADSICMSVLSVAYK